MKDTGKGVVLGFPFQHSCRQQQLDVASVCVPGVGLINSSHPPVGPRVLSPEAGHEACVDRKGVIGEMVLFPGPAPSLLSAHPTSS